MVASNSNAAAGPTASQQNGTIQKYPRWIWQKFTPDGTLLPFPGNTIICHIPPDSALYVALLDLCAALQSQPFAHLYGLLPPVSWHMTVAEGVSDQIRKPGFWPADLAVDASLEQCTAHFREKLETFDIGSGAPFKISVKGFEPLEDGIALKVAPATVEEESRLRGLRDRLSGLLQLRHPGHETYSFHVSLSYMLRFLSEKEHRDISQYLDGWIKKLPQEFELGLPEFCIFTDMFKFDRQFHLFSGFH